jgi:hypothetical protein
MGLIMKKLACLLIVAATMSSTAWAACRPPDTPRKFPDGKTATKEQMQKAQQFFADFDKKIETYRACLKDEYDAKMKKFPKADDVLKKQFFEDRQMKDDAAYLQILQVKEELNAEVRAYNEAARARKAAAAN